MRQKWRSPWGPVRFDVHKYLYATSILCHQFYFEFLVTLLYLSILPGVIFPCDTLGHKGTHDSTRAVSVGKKSDKLEYGSSDQRCYLLP